MGPCEVSSTRVMEHTAVLGLRVCNAGFMHKAERLPCPLPGNSLATCYSNYTNSTSIKSVTRRQTPLWLSIASRKATSASLMWRNAQCPYLANSSALLPIPCYCGITPGLSKPLVTFVIAATVPSSSMTGSAAASRNLERGLTSNSRALSYIGMSPAISWLLRCTRERIPSSRVAY
ncbi:hypothetical protein BU26DRAFT_136259 [Trematosphaeria pertusa]|uniref:Uncharacterized protein n=1 Tax=Trematosphaeria pertusa TaxID=390896 RepID=A0A6A6IW67_9PLEO|nr:uncharacterized protein BU26DRAFT_136259 [Trematosphaeria pertusa]KAF2254317.1 hypothetical protein BU26DRAFT_136259 [Trematosphaeria pertusa]